MAEAIAREVPLSPSMRALEYGAGTGLLSFLLRDSWARSRWPTCPMECSTSRAARSPPPGDPRMRAVRLDLSAGDAVPGEFDIVYSLMTLHHIPDTDGILRRFHDVLAQRGVLCIADLDTEDGSFHGDGFDGHKGFDRATLRAKAIAAGFADVRFTTAYEMHKEVGGRMHKFPIFLMVAVKA